MNEKIITHMSISTGTMLRAVLVILGVFLLWVLRDLVLVVLTAIVIASFVESALPRLKKIGFNRIFGVILLYVVGFLILASLFYLFAPLLITELYNFATLIALRIPGITFLDFFQNEAFSGAKDIVSNLSNGFSLGVLLSISKAFVQNLSGGFVQTLSAVFGSLFNFALIVLISFYLSIQEKGIESLLRIITPIEYEDYIVDLWDRSSKKIGLWVRGQVVLAIVVGVLIYLLLSLLGIEYALLLAIIAGVMELVPYGVIVALIPAFSFSYISGGISTALLVTGAYLIIHEFEVFLFTPLIINKVVGLSPIVIILSILVGFELLGIWGAFIAIPFAIIFMELLNDVEKHKISARSNK